MSEFGAASTAMQPVASQVCMRAVLCALAAERPQLDVLRVLEFDGALHATVARALGARQAAPAAGEAHALRAALSRVTAPALRRLLLDLCTPAATGVAVAPLPALDWHARLDSALRAELYAEALGIGDALEARIAVLRGLAGGFADPAPQALARYRSYPLDDLVDAPTALRVGISAIVGPEQRQAHAERLLGLDAARVQSLEEHLPVRRSALLERAGLAPAWDDDAERLAADEVTVLRAWLGRARRWHDAMPLATAPGASTPVTGSTNAADSCAHACAAITRALDARVLLLVGDASDTVLQRPGQQDDFRLGIAHERSRVAAAVRSGDVCRLARWETTAVVDHALFDMLGADELHVASVRTAHGRRVLLASPLPGVPAEVARVALRATIAEWAERLDREVALAEHARGTVASVRAELERSVRSTVHEVSSPLAIIGNYLHLLRTTFALPPADGQQPIGEGSAASPQAEYLQAMQEELARAATLLHDMTARAATGGGDDDAEAGAGGQRLTSGQMLRAVQAALRPLAQARGVQLEVADEGTSDAVIDNVEPVRQVLVNLARNALEAVTPPMGRVRLSTASARYRDGHPHVVFEVIDNGPGLPPAQRLQLAAPKQSTKGGAGLGLAIAHQLARERLHGSLDYEGGRDGSLFRLWVPEPGHAPTGD